MIEHKVHQLKIFSSEESMGDAVGYEVGEILREYTVKKRQKVLANFAAAPSQDAFLAQLCREEGIEWKRVYAIHLDEYIDLERGHPNTFEMYLRERLFDNIPIPDENVHYIKSLKGSSEEMAGQYDGIIREHLSEIQENGGIYIACIGIGVNGHIAFNEPHVDKRTTRFVIPVEIDEVSVQQQYDDYKNHPNPAARYSSIEDVPRKAVTVSCRGILDADKIYCTVPGQHKADAVKGMLDGPITDKLPASLLRMHPSLNIYLDSASASLLDNM